MESIHTRVRVSVRAVPELGRAALLPYDLLAALKDIYDEQGKDAFRLAAERVFEVTAAVVLRASGPDRLDEILAKIGVVADELEPPLPGSSLH